MERVPTTARLPESARFQTTHWSVVLLAGRDGPGRDRALEQFSRTYWLPIYGFIRRNGQSPEDASDLTQEFFARLLEKKWLSNVEPRENARFSTLLLTMVKRFLINERNRNQAEKRGGGQIPVDFSQGEEWIKTELLSNETPEKMFERHWAHAVLDAALGRLRAEAGALGKARQFEVLSPFLSREASRGDYETAGEILDLSASTVRVAVHRLRHRYRDLLREELAVGRLSRDQVDEEMRHLFAALA